MTKKFPVMVLAAAMLFSLGSVFAGGTAQATEASEPASSSIVESSSLEPNSLGDAASASSSASNPESEVAPESIFQPESELASEPTSTPESFAKEGFGASAFGFTPFGIGVEVDSLSDLSAALAAVTADGSIIYLTDAFAADLAVTGNATYSTAIAFNVTIDGSRLTAPLTSKAGLRHFTFKSNGTANVTFANMVLEGNGGVGGFDLSYGNYTLNNVQVQNCSNGLAGALVYRNGTQLTITGSSFVNNLASHPGYYGGAIAAEAPVNSNVVIENFYFEKNMYTVSNNNVGRGGAIGIHRPSGGSLSVNNCYFVGNETKNTAGTGDGGAISVYCDSGTAAYPLTVTNSTFYQNKAGYDAGAIFMEGRPNSAGDFLATAVITNNTFVENTANGMLYTMFNTGRGGAIQLSLKVKGTITDNVFYNNSSKLGGAINGHVASGQAPDFTLLNNVFINNKTSSTATSANVFLPDSEVNADAASTNLGYDNGTALNAAYTLLTVFGTSAPTLAANDTKQASVGYAADPAQNTQKAPTLWIGPRLNDTPYYADGAGIAGSATTDQRGFDRGTTKDAGAVEITWAMFDANEGQWATTPTTAYNYTNPVLYAGGTDTIAPVTDGSAATLAYSVTNVGGTVSILPANPTRENYSFKGWGTTKTTTTPLTTAELAALSATEQTLYAIWAAPASFTVTYVTNPADTGITGAVPTDSTLYSAGDNATVLGKNTLAREGYTFAGWLSNETPAKTYTGSGSEVLIMPAQNVVLTARWEIIPTYTLTYHVNGGTGTNYTDTVTYSGDAVVSQLKTLAEVGGWTRSGYTFSGWGLSAGSTATISNVAFAGQNIVLYAVWKAEPVSSSSTSSSTSSSSSSVPPTPPASSSSSPSSSSSSRASSSRVVVAISSSSSSAASSSSEPASSSSDVSSAAPSSSIVTSIGNDDPPLGNPAYWSLFDLILMIVSALGTVLLLVRAVAGKKEQDSGRKRPFRVSALLGILLGPVSVILFFVTQNLKNPMRIFDFYSPFFAIILILQIVFAIFFLRSYRQEEEEYEEEGN